MVARPDTVPAMAVAAMLDVATKPMKLFIRSSRGKHGEITIAQALGLTREYDVCFRAPSPNRPLTGLGR